MGEVWAAVDRTSQRQVALKALPAGDDLDGELLEKFRREVLTGSRVSHPHVAALYDSGVHDDALFLVTERVDGPALSQVIGREGQLELRRALEIALGVAEALEAAHSVGVVHHDITPGSVMLTAEGRVKVVDFGVAGFVQEAFSLAHSSKLGPAGTPEYVAPERFDGEGGGGAHSDLYGLGGVLFAMLTGRPPFTGLNLYAVLALKASEPAPDARSLRPELPAGVAGLVARLLDRDPAGRPAGAAETVRELRALLAAAGDEAVPEEPAAPEPAADDLRGLPPAFGPALRIAEGVEVPALRSEVLAVLGSLALWRDPDALERHLRRTAPAVLARLAGQGAKAGALLAGVRHTADSLGDPDAVVRFVHRFVPERGRAAELLLLAREFGAEGGEAAEEAAGRLCLAAGALLEPAAAVLPTADLVALATAAARWEPRRAGAWADRVDLALPHADRGELLRATELAVLLDRFDPVRARRLLDRVAAAVRADGWAEGVRAPVAVPALARIAMAGRPTSADFAALVLAVALDRALLADKGLRSGVLAAYAVELAGLGGPPDAVKEALAAIAGRTDAGRAWGQVLAAARYEDAAELAELVDEAERALVQRRGRQGRLSGLRGRLEGDSSERFPTWFVEGAARHDPARAQAVAQHLTEPECLARAHLALANAAAGTDLATARVHLSSAYAQARAAQGPDGAGAQQVMADLATTAAALDPGLAKRAAGHLDGWARAAGTDGHRIAELALVLVPLDPALAEGLLTAADERARIDADFSAVLHTLAGLAAAYAATARPRTEEMADRILAASRAVLEDRVRASAWQHSLPGLVARAPEIAAVLVQRYAAADRAALVKAVAPALARTDPYRAEQLARTLQDAESRDGARTQIADHLARRAALAPRPAAPAARPAPLALPPLPGPGHSGL
jgi:serine/threonine-protein kinase